LSEQNIFLEIFKKQEIKEESPNLKLENFTPIDIQDTNLNSFLSVIHFYDNLCNICEIMRVAPEQKQLQILQSELLKVNQLLPSNVYIPFLSETIRNYIIVHIPVSETKIFRTKTRAPFMITVELIRIDELI
jgi:phosphatidylinositol 4-kinase